ncbi:MAG: GNAT family N-acetyltransferase [Alphaproteobacteria bacterium]|jgi:GNAT superfamily N-acetyltransferase|nr:GNAT family N-acetyltransferase [Alphaproteobacteria bacterium]
MSVTCRTATVTEVGTLLDWAAQEGWNPGLDDAAPFHAADPHGFFVAETQGQPVAGISVVNHDGSTAFLGLYLCLPDWRGRGIGLRLWHHALTHAGARRVLLDGVAAQQANYAKSGFRKIGETRRWRGDLPPARHDDIRTIHPADIPALVALDAAVQGYSRDRFMQAWLYPTATRRSVMTADGTGFATARLCHDGCKIGPVIAPDADTALRLSASAAQVLGTRRATIDVPADQAGFAAGLQGLAFQTSFATARMVRGTVPTLLPHGHATATLELG